ncbi:hypothetical protein BDW67DRAFT_690 [Aspergillus spinulosporus]
MPKATTQTDDAAAGDDPRACGKEIDTSQFISRVQVVDDRWRSQYHTYLCLIARIYAGLLAVSLLLFLLPPSTTSTERGQGVHVLPYFVEQRILAPPRIPGILFPRVV